ncbi:hypothetical protein E2562_000615 [Oryza meyeriana var. granulata]|uniref:Uncharacterized protein n=1 Tax=Oryza meyeriana var. granulata TaxID=110450 RepID=A0A6G1DUV1_9ORYZ|nr:hypothetical protein E2562_000615 [Oryza meyeriana var. granulata]
MEVEAEEAAAGERKRKRDGGGASVGEVVRGDDGEVHEDEEVYEGIAEESVEELMRWLEMEITVAPEMKEEDEEDADDHAASSFAAPGFVTINGNEESCGPSFSAAASTVMASVDTRAGAPPPPPVPWPLPPSSSSSAAVGELDFELELELDDAEWLAELLTSGPALEEPQAAVA